MAGAEGEQQGVNFYSIYSLVQPSIAYQRIIECFGLEGTLRIIWFHPPAISRDIFPQPRVLRAPSNLALSTAREGPSTASLGSLGQGLTTLKVKSFFLMSNLNLLSV